MADENTPAFYPRVGQNIAKNFRSAQPPAFIEDPRAMDLPQYGDVDLSVPNQANLEMSRRMAQRQADLKRQQERDRSPLEKAAGALQTGRLMGSALTQAINSMPTRIAKGDEAADKFMQERMYQPTQPLAYEYAEDIGDMLGRLETEYKIPPVLPEAMALQFLTGPATSQASRATGRGAEQVGRKLESAMEPVVKGALEQGGLPREMVMAMGANTQSNVIKPPNGNWFGTSLPESMAQFKRNTVAGNDPALILGEMRERYTPEVIEGLQEGSRNHVIESLALIEKDVALNNWVDRNLNNYVKKQMATPEDPVRKLAEEGIVHIPTSEVGVNRYRAPEHRNRYGGEQLGQSEAAKAWEDASDVAINAPKVEEIISPGFIDRNPYVEKLPLDERIYGLNSPASYSQEIKGLGFDHIIDVLREDVASGRIRPEQLNKVSMEQAVRRTYEYDQELARRMNEARATSRAELPVYKEYPEGLKWVELNRPGDFAAESDAMGHSVRGYEPPEGHPDWTKGSGDSGSSGYGLGGWEAIKSGDAKVYSLVDAKGEPHVTIEVGKARPTKADLEKQPQEVQDEFQRRFDNWVNNIDYRPNPEETRRETELLFRNMNIPTSERINQIKGKQNAKPKDDYLPFVQDFVKGGNWSDIGDFKNTGLIREGGQIMTPAEHADWLLKELGADTYNELGLGAKPPPPAGMKAGGKVSISNNPDTMMLELGNKRMKEGGSEDDTKPYFGGAGTKKYAAAKKRAEQGDVNTLRDPKTYAAVAGFMGERPDEMGFSVLHPDYQAIKDVAEPAFGLGIAAQAYPLIGPLTKGLPVGASVKNVTPMKASEALGMIEGRPLKITQSDRTKVGGGFLGGPGFSSLQLTEPEYRAAEAAWGVQNAGTAKTILGGGGDNAVYAAMIGTPTQHQSNQMVFDKLLGDFKKAAKRGELTPELRDLINMRLAAAVDNKGNPVFPANVDIMDKKFRDIADTFSRRSVAGHLMGGVQVGGKKGQIIDYDKIIRSTTDPALLDQPTGALGNRLFTLSGGIVQRPDLHPAFPTILQGEDLGVMFTPVERDIVMKDFVEKTMREKGRKPGYMDYTRGNPPTQLITEDILTELQKLGKKKGGAIKKPVHKAEGGEVSGDDLILEERPL